eukprot:TRINITY_DN60335_c0_g1_i1.p1 TRINITY_DN60335_c0_g1~~TRINITY_DN60335_c0_g1_i1.p1  ORF type:complete len:119 (+),score=19.29 TRINITY_DN60335_c0_g1_i1:87-443(+)
MVQATTSLVLSSAQGLQHGNKGELEDLRQWANQMHDTYKVLRSEAGDLWQRSYQAASKELSDVVYDTGLAVHNIIERRADLKEFAEESTNAQDGTNVSVLKLALLTLAVCMVVYFVSV